MLLVFLFFVLQLDYAARVKSSTDAEKYYSKAVGLLKTVITKI
jgi:hypothetical protein